MPTFTTPTTRWNGGDILFGRYSFPVGVSVVWTGATFEERPTPWLGEIAELTDGETYFLGGRTYEVTPETAALLTAAGFTVED